MDILKTFLFITVLTGPLWLMLILLAVSLWIAVKVARRLKPGVFRFVGGVSVFLLLVCLPFVDEIAGRIYLNHLCTTEAGVKIYQTVELPAEYWDDEGKPRYLGTNGFVDMKLLPNRFEWHNVNESYIDSVIKIGKRRWQLLDKDTQTILGERITYMRHFGWINRFSLAPNIGEGCAYLGGQKDREQEKKYFNDIFKSAESAR